MNNNSMARCAREFFMGYHLHSGGKWPGDNLVIGQTVYSTAARHCGLCVHHVREVLSDPPWSFLARCIVLPSERHNNDVGLTIDDGMIRRTPTDFDYTAHGAHDTRRSSVMRYLSSPKRIAEGPGSESDLLPNDEWILKAGALFRKHNKPRRAMFRPVECDEPLPIPMDTIDITRCTTTSLDTIDEGRIVDVWDGTVHDTRLSLFFRLGW